MALMKFANRDVLLREAWHFSRRRGKNFRPWDAGLTRAMTPAGHTSVQRTEHSGPLPHPLRTQKSRRWNYELRKVRSKVATRSPSLKSRSRGPVALPLIVDPGCRL